jgi:hypothetical protein
LKTYRGTRKCDTVQLVLCDARDFHIPEENAICYFWDPFEAELMETILENVRNSLAAVPRDIYIVYFMPVHRRLFDKVDFLTLVKQASWYCIYRASGNRSLTSPRMDLAETQSDTPKAKCPAQPAERTVRPINAITAQA